MDWIHVDYCDVFICCLDSHSDGTHSLQRDPLMSSDVILHFPNLFWWRNKLIYILDGLSFSKVLANFHFGINYSFILLKHYSKDFYIVTKDFNFK